MPEHVCAYVKISGRVQGVFFRAETQKMAVQFGLCGWVRNCQDGTVEAVFQGNQKDVQEAVNWCHSGSPSARVSNVDVHWREYEDGLKSFDIRY